ncbi:glutamate decarboxylase [Aspergillus saccharolyticus JOP 1030-1]|uniref:glutamate decarboxylase n=1 Tax=Aspergillus saccharolyticus JOP 1030-1 TaxID=1450539 RepID=A0A318Z719_9EURO|nr:glutamate decarboxylase [Aspergillus saccharolyticus JOP 1030-1]PYH42234.1 glutamate decarboxylase [Aspergillus saccharolyticus JOP 1030-1]
MFTWKGLWSGLVASVSTGIFSQKQLTASHTTDHAGRPHIRDEAAIPPLNSVALEELPENSMTQEATYALLQRELSRDTNPQYNLATFVTTCMEPEATRLIAENLAKNFVEAKAYPVASQIEKRCLTLSTLESSEAIILAVLALKSKWIRRQQATHKADCPTPNIIISSAAQICWKKAAHYCEIDVQYVPCSEDRTGTTYTGEYEDVKKVNDLLLQRRLEIPIHVDAASGGFVAPFLSPDMTWDFRLERVVSINVSGHKYGLVYAGIGWGLWRSPDELPQDLIFHLSYLGIKQSSFTLIFSKSSSHVIAQYYQFLRLGRVGYCTTIRHIAEVATHLADSLQSLGFHILSQPDGLRGIPVVAFRINRRFHCDVDEFDLSRRLAVVGWQVPTYHMADGAGQMALLRVVCRADFTRAIADQFISAVESCMRSHLSNSVDIGQS